MIQLGHDHFLFGFNVELGLKQGQLSDVFAVYDYDEAAEEQEGDLSILHDAKFQERFGVMFSGMPAFIGLPRLAQTLYCVHRQQSGASQFISG